METSYHIFPFVSFVSFFPKFCFCLGSRQRLWRPGQLVRGESRDRWSACQSRFAHPQFELEIHLAEMAWVAAGI